MFCIEKVTRGTDESYLSEKETTHRFTYFIVYQILANKMHNNGVGKQFFSKKHFFNIEGIDHVDINH